MANLTRQGREKIRKQVTDKVARPIQFFWRANLESNQQYYRDSIKLDPEQDGAIQVYSKEKVLKFLEYGTSPHLIEPKNAEALRWFNEEGKPVFAKKVRHPGTQPQAALRRSIDRVRNSVER